MKQEIFLEIFRFIYIINLFIQNFINQLNHLNSKIFKFGESFQIHFFQFLSNFIIS